MWKGRYIIFSSFFAFLYGSHNVIPDTKQRAYYTQFVQPDQRLVSRAVASPAVSPIPAPYYPSPYSPLYLPQTQLTRQVTPYQYFPAPVYPNPYQYYIPGPGFGAPPSYVYLSRYPAESGSEQGSGSTSVWPSWALFQQYFPFSGFGGGNNEAEAPTNPAAEGAGQGASPPKGKPEKLEATEVSAQESGKSEAEKNSEAEQIQPQVPQYGLVGGYPQFFGHFAAFPSDRDPTAISAASKGAISSFLFYKDQAQHAPFQQPQQLPQQQVQKAVDNQNSVGSAQIAYQRYLLLSKQRSDEGGIKQAVKQDANTSQKEVKSDINSDSSQTKSAGLN